MRSERLKQIQKVAKESQQLKQTTSERDVCLVIELLAEIARRLPPPLDDDE